jgi:hypothetical protein
MACTEFFTKNSHETNVVHYDLGECKEGTVQAVSSGEASGMSSVLGSDTDNSE